MPLGTVKKINGSWIVALNDKKSKYYKTQQSLSVHPCYNVRFNLKEGDIVEFEYGEPYSYIRINLKIKSRDGAVGSSVGS